LSGYSTTDTFSSLVDEVITSLMGYSTLGDQPLNLLKDITAASTSFQVWPFTIARGVVEIDEELIFVNETNEGWCGVSTWGRGWRGTTPAAHTAGTPVYVAPVYPRSIVSREVNNTIRSIYPDLFAAKTADLTASAVSWQYELPADCERVLSVEWRWDTISGWNPLVDWEMVTSANTTDFASGKFLSIQAGIPVASKIHVTYAALPTLLAAPTDAFTTTGLPSTARDVVVLGTAARLIPWIDAGRTPASSVPSDLTDQQRPIGAAIQLARDLRDRYQTRLAKERDSLYSRYPIRAHRIRG
jgi:hypothetical protein